MWIAIGISIAALVAVIMLLLLSARVPRYDVSSQGLTISNSLFGRTIPIGELNVREARLIDLEASPEFRPKWRTFGIGLPGRLSGWFRLRNGEKALVFLSGGNRAIRIPTAHGYSLLIDPDNPEQVLAALTRQAG